MAANYQTADLDEQIRHYMPLVRRIASHICSRLSANVQLDDLMQEGLSGLLDALKRYKPQAGQSFESYASMRIRGAIYDACRQNDLLPRSQRDQVDRITQISQRLEQTLERPALEQEIADALGVALDDYRKTLTNVVNVTPIDQVPEGLLSDSGRGDPLDTVQMQQFLQTMVAILEELPEKQQMVMTLHYQEDLSYREIAAVMDLTPGRISQLHTEAMIAIRGHLRLSHADWFFSS
jgi:RNA polymerase sigma factor FliA